MKRLKPLTIVFLSLNALVLLAAIVIMIYFAINPIYAGPTKLAFYTVAVYLCLPPLFLINLVWLIIWRIRNRKNDSDETSDW